MPELKTTHTPEIEDTESGLRIAMRAPRAAGCLIAFFAVWTTGWTIGGFTAISAVFNAGGPWWNPLRLFLLLWLAGWVIGEVLGIWMLLFFMAGKEILTFDGTTMTRRVEAFGRGLDFRYQMAEMSRFRPMGEDGKNDFVGFEYRGKSVRMGTNLDEIESARIVELVVSRYPQLGVEAS
jgi:hypothetical protein